MQPLFLDLLTVFFLVSGFLLIWLNWRSRPHVIIPAIDDSSEATPSSEMLKTVAARKAQGQPDLTQEDLSRLNTLLDEVVSSKNPVR